MRLQRAALGEGARVEIEHHRAVAELLAQMEPERPASERAAGGEIGRRRTDRQRRDGGGGREREREGGDGGEEAHDRRTPWLDGGRIGAKAERC